MLERLLLAGTITLSLHFFLQLGGRPAPLSGSDRYQQQSYANLTVQKEVLKQ